MKATRARGGNKQEAKTKKDSALFQVLPAVQEAIRRAEESGQRREVGGSTALKKGFRAAAAGGLVARPRRDAKGRILGIGKFRVIPILPEYVQRFIREAARENRLSPRSVKTVQEIAENAKVDHSDSLYLLEIGDRIVQILGDGSIKEFGFFNKSGRIEPAKDEGLLNQWLQKYFEEINLPQSQWMTTAAEIGRVVRKQLIAATERPRWDDRAGYPELANLSAPEFLKRVWADQFDPDGSIARELVSDKNLLKIVGTYIGKRRDRGLNLGDAKGLRLVRGKTGRPARPSAG